MHFCGKLIESNNTALTSVVRWYWRHISTRLFDELSFYHSSSSPFGSATIQPAQRRPSAPSAHQPTRNGPPHSTAPTGPARPHITPINIYTRYDAPLKKLQNLSVWRSLRDFKLLQVMVSAEIGIGSICRHIRLAPVVG